MTRLTRFLGTGNSGENVGNGRLKTVFDSESKLKPGIPKGKVAEKKLPAKVNSGKTTIQSQLCGARSVLRDKEKSGEYVGDNRIKADSDQEKQTVKESL